MLTLVCIGSLIRDRQSLTSMAEEVHRVLSWNLGNGNCKWTPPIYDVPEDIEFEKFLIAGFPSE